MSDWRSELRDLTRDLGGQVRRVARAVDSAVDRDPFHIVGYRGYATRWRALVIARVLQDQGSTKADPSHGQWQNLLNTIRRLESDPMPFAKVRASVGGSTHELVADDEGFVREWIKLPEALDENQSHDIELELAGSTSETPVQGVARVFVPSPASPFGVISDIDDTVLQSDVTVFFRAMRLMLLENSRTRLPFPGVAAFYRALRDGRTAGPKNPIFYVSSSPWSVYDVIVDFLDAHEIPAGALFLRDWDLASALTRSGGGHSNHKLSIIREILGAYPWMKFILVGDSGHEDPEIYASIVAEYPGRILAVYIRDVNKTAMRSSAIAVLADQVRLSASELVFGADTIALAQHAAAKGWIDPARLADVREEKKAS